MKKNWLIENFNIIYQINIIYYYYKLLKFNFKK